MEAGENFNQEISDQDLANDKRQKRPISSVLEDDGRPEFFKRTFISKENNGRNDLIKEVDENIDFAEGWHRRRQFYASSYFEPQLTPHEQQVTLKLLFRVPDLSGPIFTGNKIRDYENNPLQLVLVGEDQVTPVYLDPPPKVEIVVLHGDFPASGCDYWSSSEFDAKIVKERSGKPPLLLGNLIVPLTGGSATIGDIKITDNSSWIPSGKFKIGARVVPRKNTQDLRVLEAMTEAYKVRDSRGELYKKHYPPILEDEVWRLEKIGKDGVFHKRLASEGINTLRDFLNLSATDPRRLKEMLGPRMSEKMWEVVLEHANTCKILSHEQEGCTDRIHENHKLTCWDGFHNTSIQGKSNYHGGSIDPQNLSHVQPNEHPNKNDSEESDESFGSLDEVLASASKIDIFQS